jgi:hypothetical protein
MKKLLLSLIVLTASVYAGDHIPLESTNKPITFSIGGKYQGGSVSTLKNGKWTGYGWANKETAVLRADLHNGLELIFEDYLTESQVKTSSTKTKKGITKTTNKTTEATTGGFEFKPRYTFHLTKKLDFGLQAGLGDSYGIHNTALVNKFYYIGEARLVYKINDWLKLRTSYQLQNPFNTQYDNWVNTVKIGPDFRITKNIDTTLSYVNNFGGTQHGNGFESSLNFRF